MVSRDALTEEEEHKALLRDESADYAIASEVESISHGRVVSEEEDGSYIVETLPGGKRLGKLTYRLPLKIGDVGIVFEKDSEITFIRKPLD